MIRLFCIGLFLYTSFPGYCHGLNKVLPLKDSLRLDSTKIERRSFTVPLREKYNDDVYIYERNANTKGWYTRFKEWLARILSDLFELDGGKEAANLADILVNLFYILIVLAVIFIIVKAIMNKEGRWVFGKASDKKLVTAGHAEDNIHETDFQSLIKIATEKKDHRLAIRYYYLWVLKELTRKQYIEYHPDKTNSDYLTELQQNTVKNDFGYASYLYNYIWYGEFDVEPNQFVRAISSFQGLLKKISV